MERLKSVLSSLAARAKANPRAAFLAALGALVAAGILVPSLAPKGRPQPPPADAPAAQAGAPAAARPSAAGAPARIAPVTAGPVRAEEFGEGRAPLTLGGILPPGPGLRILPDDAEYKWGGPTDGASGRDEVRREAATVTWPLGGRYASLSAAVGFFMPSGEDMKKRGGEYGLYVDGRRVWGKTLTAEDAAAGRAADERVSLDLRGAKTLTLRIASVPVRGYGWQGREWGPSIPFPMLLYDIDLKPAEVGSQ